VISKNNRALGAFTLAAIAAAGCDRGGGTAGIDGSGVQAPVAAVAFGRVTEFGSVWVNGIRYDTSRATFTIDGETGSQADLDVGDIVFVSGRVDAARASNGVADRIVFEHAVKGPTSAIDASSGSLVALGQTIRTGPDTLFGDSVSQGGLAGLKVGDAVEVAGFRNARGEIQATRIDVQAAGVPELMVTGVVANIDLASKRFAINGLVVDYGSAEDRSGGAGIANGDVVIVKGASLGGSGELVATDLSLRDMSGRAGDRADIEGYITTFDAENPLRFEVEGLPVAATTGTLRGGLGLDVRIEVEGSLNSNGVVVASEVRTGLPPTVGPYTIEGQVFDAYAGPIADAALNLWVERDGGGGYSYWWAHGPLISDQSGRFRAPDLPAARIAIWAFKTGFVQPCAVTVADLHSDLTLNVEMTSESTLNALDPPRPQSAREPWVTGMIFENTPTGRQPVVGADLFADLHGMGGTGVATTRSDQRGSYFLCNLPADTFLSVAMPGFLDTMVGPIDVSQSTTRDIELRRQ
jgi:hypothetical protein